MVLVDSSVWIEYLSPKTSPIDSKLEALIRPHNQVVVTGVVLQEVLQGIKNPRSYRLTQRLLERLPFLTATLQTHLKAAEIFKETRSRGKNPTTVDVLIAALAIENRLPLFTLDRDFQAIQTHSELEIFQ